jgi:hypothetical protein
MSDLGIADEQQIEKVAYTGDLRFISEKLAPSVLADIVSEKYNKDWLEWSPETLRQTVQRDFVTEIHPVNWEKLQAAKLLLLTDDFWHDWQVFAPVVKAFNHLIPHFGMAEECSPGEMAWALSEADKIRVENFSDEVTLYVRANCLNHGLILYPDQLSFAQGELGKQERIIRDAWLLASKDLTFAVKEDELGIQLARLNSVRHYLKALQGESEQIVLKHQKRW